jgi:hypothetical protein
MIKKKLILLFGIIILTSGCTNLTLLASAGGMAISQNTLMKAYNGLDFITTITTEKSIKTHIYEKHVQTFTRFFKH